MRLFAKQTTCKSRRTRLIEALELKCESTNHFCVPLIMDYNHRSLVFEASVGQTVKIDCNVLANPAKSVHYAWFSVPSEQNLTSWTQRDTSPDEQLEESG